MLFITAKVSKKRVLWTVAVFLAAAAIIIFLPKENNNTDSISASTDTERIEALSRFGWEVSSECAEAQKITIPNEFSETYEKYNELQKEAGFDLMQYRGKAATRYSYLVLNYPDYDGEVYADLLVCDDELIGGDIHSLSLDGFMVSLVND